MSTRLSIYEDLDIEPDSDEAWVLLSLYQQDLFGTEIVEWVKQKSSDSRSLRLGWVYVTLWVFNGKGLVNAYRSPIRDLTKWCEDPVDLEKSEKFKECT